MQRILVETGTWAGESRVLWLGTMLAILGFTFVLAACQGSEQTAKGTLVALTMPRSLKHKLSDGALTIPVTVQNTGSEPIESAKQDFLTYHLIDAAGRMVTWDGVRTVLPTIAPGATLKVNMKVDPPKAPGKFGIQVDLVREGQFWYAEKGNPTLKIALNLAQ
jgi:hypothetical protein